MVVVARLTKRAAHLQMVEPIDVGEPAFLLHVPSEAEVVEVAPTVVGREGRGTIVAVAQVEEEALVEVVVAGEEEAGCAILVYGASARTLVDDVAHSVVALAVFVLSLGIEVVDLQPVALKTGSNVHIVLAESVEVVEQILMGEGRGAGLLRDILTAVARRLAIEARRTAVEDGVVAIESDASRGRETVGEVDLGKPVAVEDVAVELTEVVEQVALRVGHRHPVAGGVGRQAVAIVVDLLAGGLVVHDVAVGVAHIHWVDGSDEVGDVEGIARGGGVLAALLTRIERVGVGETDVGTNREPLGHLVFSVEAGVEALEARTLDDTLIVEIAEAAEIVEAVVGTRDAHVVLLAELGVESLVLPVVGRIEIGAVAVAQRGVGIELAIGADEVLTRGHGPDAVARG